MKTIHLLLIMLWLLPSTAALAQDSADTLHAPPLISGYADVYYKYNFNENATDNKTSFTNSQNSFELGMISVKLAHSFGKVSFLGNLAFGKRADAFSYRASGSSVAIEQLYVSYAPTGWLKLSAGSFSTHVGYELPDANLNHNYSMSYMFSYGPFLHTGLKADFTAGKNTFMVGVFDPTDYKYAPAGGKKYLGAQWGFVPEGSPFHSYLNYIGGKDTAGVRSDQVDLVMTYAISDRFSLGYDGTVTRYGMPAGGNASWWGSALYIDAGVTKNFSLCLRSEYFDDPDGTTIYTDRASFPTGGNVLAFTLSGNYKIGPLVLIPEFRIDEASAPLFNKRSGAPGRSSPSVLAAAVYTF